MSDAHGQTIWQASVDGTATAASFDARATQDFNGLWGVFARRTVEGQKTDVDIAYASPGQAYPSRGAVPLSRGKACDLHSGATPVHVSPCPLTDGDLGTRYSPQPRPSCPQGQTCDTGANNWLGVDLGADTALSKLFLYDVAVSGATGLIVEGSDDGTAWRALASATAKPYLALPLVGSARYVRVRLLSATAEFRGSGNAELAIY